MDEELEELESLFSEHFGRTPSATPCVSQMSDYSDEEESDFDEHIELGRVADVDQRVRQYLDSLPASHSDESQNKNQYVIGYFMWRVMTGRHQEIEYHMQIPGHARCLVDSGFASLKKLYRRTDCDSLVQLQHVVDMSSATNEAVRYPAWQWRDWKSFLGPVIKPMRGIRKYQYFKMSSDKPGVVTVKENRDTDETTVNVLRFQDRVFPADDLPTVIPAHGLTRERQDYLYKAVRPYVRPMHQDSTCPAPSDQ
ncbi:uncharacterized protein LOC128554725 isoform X2 [Mercenaria mercenaria]|uniref:uncharacterized protein LOC128554725 isoform X2 n=1 Tax=Mercenaria mercenaria TaxID=6596 RepID=UPI00234F8BB8|nr:uncharacterized protein LOC128554725 isoform X2 [Mercenaria mercenaria]